MKTPIQELIDWIEERFNNPKETEVFKKATELLEKEKQQIKKAYKNGRICIKPLDVMVEEDYYNQTYNQNQHIIDIMKADEDDELYKMFDTDSDKKH
jgi:hypothetical protein